MVAWQIWLVVALIFTLIETATPTFFIFWFGVGAAGGALTAYLGGHFVLQMLVFLGVSALLVTITRPFARGVLRKSRVKTNVDAVTGRTGTVLGRIEGRNRPGLVRVEGETWTAVPADDAVIEQGERVTVLRIEGVKAIVEPLQTDHGPQGQGG
ncbi:MAG: NfeD family protein [Chloroflexota bacterium]